jgi:hypothetical protein
MFVALLSGMFLDMYTINTLTPQPIPIKFGVLTNQNTTKNVGYKRMLILASIGVFPLIKVSPINPRMHCLLLGGGPVLFVCVTMAAAQQRGNPFFSWVRCQAAARK